MNLRILAAFVLVLVLLTGCTTTITFQMELDRPLTLGADGPPGDE